jgi:nicotinamidase/pyrazinamidase
MNIDFSNSALLLIDVQKDFCPGGALAVEKGDEIIEPLNRLSRLFAAHGGKVAATQDWHPHGHASFASSHKKKLPGETLDLPGVKGQMLWPDHCVQCSHGSDFHESLEMKPVNIIIRKGFRQNLDSYSAFFENDRKTPTGLEGFLKTLSIDTLVLGGLATDYCVLYSALDAASLGFKTIVAFDAARGVDFPKGSVEEAYSSLEKAGIILVTAGEIK